MVYAIVGCGLVESGRYTAGIGGMSMADRKESDAPQHETFPGPGPSRIDDGNGAHPVEQMVDAAIDRIAREYRDSGGSLPDKSLAVRTSRSTRTGRLRWKGLDVSDEFRQYAERVARGEDLPPYAGRVLAEPNAIFPWEPAARRKASRRARAARIGLFSSAALVVGLLGWTFAVKFHGSDAESPLAAAQRAADEAGSVSNGTVSQSVNALEPDAPALPDAVSDGESAAAPPSAELAGSEPSEPPSAELAGSGAAGSATATEVAKVAAPPTESSSERMSAPPVTAAAPVAPPATSQSRIDDDPAGRAQSSPPAQTAPPGALREAIGAIFAARATPDAFSEQGNAPPTQTPAEPGATPAPGAPGPSAPVAGRAATPPASAPVRPSAAPAAPANDAAKAGTARKETGSQSSAKGSLLVETPSF
jgi:hypothetical protein